MQSLISLQRHVHIRVLDRDGDRGASLVEYALLVALIAIVCIIAVVFFGEETSSSFKGSSDSLFG